MPGTLHRTATAIATAMLGVGLGTVALAPPAGAVTTTGQVGADISYPQCGGSGQSPTGEDFGIVGVNDGRPGSSNPCFAAEWTWAKGTAGGAQAYVNTADPGNTVSDWPTDDSQSAAAGVTDPYGTCTTVRSRGKTVGADSTACAFEYGVEQARYDESAATSQAPASWWLDVETSNSWLTRSQIGLNQADLDGMVLALDKTGTVGAYSTHYQWNKIVGSLDGTAGPTLNGLAQWLPTGSDVGVTTASADCTDPSALPSFTNGTRAYVQWTTSTVDQDVAC